MSAQSLSSRDLTVEDMDEAEALALLASARSASWRQFPAYSRAAADAVGAASRYCMVTAGDEPIALANVRVKYLPMVKFGIAMISQGPVMLAGEDRRREAIAALREQLVEGESLTLQIDSPVHLGEGRADAPPGFETVTASQYETFLIDLSKDEEELRADLNGKWRTDLRRGERGDVTITRSSDPDDIRKLQPLLVELSDSKGFDVPQDAEFFAGIAANTSDAEHFAIHLAWHKGALIGAHVGAFSGDVAVYLIGATNAEGRNLRAAFLLQWAVIEYAQTRGQRWYDLGGADEVDNPHVFRFKKRMGGEHYVGPAMIEAQAPWPRGAIVRLAKAVYERVRS